MAGGSQWWPWQALQALTLLSAILVMADSSSSWTLARSRSPLPPSLSLGQQKLPNLSGLRLRGGDPQAEVDEMLKTLINKSPVMLFMKGSPSQPQCGFSKQMVALLQRHKIEFDHFDILQDELVRQELKRYSKWATYPQLYVNGELVGGLDICKELVESGELEKYCKVDAGKDKITTEVIENKVTQALDATLVKAEDLSDGCGLKFSILVVSPQFEGMPLIERHRAVHAALEKETPDIHALTLKCLTPQQHQAAST